MIDENSYTLPQLCGLNTNNSNMRIQRWKPKTQTNSHKCFVKTIQHKKCTYRNPSGHHHGNG